LDERPEIFRGRFVLVGGEYTGSGDLYSRTPHPHGLPGEVSGLVLQALMLNTLLQGQPIRDFVGPFLIVGLGLCIAWLTMAILAWPRLSPVILGLLLVCVAYAGLSFALFRQNRRLLPISGPVIVLGLAPVPALWLRRKLPPWPEPVLEETEP